MFYTIYKTTNLINGKIYIGKHKAENINDDYLGSGKQLGFAIAKHGIENFSKEILFVFDNEDEMNAKEAELVTEEFVKEDTNYNLCPGGQGGWGYLNSEKGLELESRIASIDQWNKNARKKHLHLLSNDEEYRKSFSKIMKIATQRKLKENPEAYSHFKDKTHSIESKEIMSKRKLGHNFQKGEKNSQYGKIWIYSDVMKKSIRIDKNDPIPEGWTKGRKIKFD